MVLALGVCWYFCGGRGGGRGGDDTDGDSGGSWSWWSRWKSGGDNTDGDDDGATVRVPLVVRCAARTPPHQPAVQADVQVFSSILPVTGK